MRTLLGVVLMLLWLLTAGGLSIVSLYASGRLLPLIMGLALLGMAVATWILPMGFGYGLNCGSLNHPRFPGFGGAPFGSMAERCQSNGDLWGGLWLATLTGGIGSMLVSIWRSIGGRRTLILVAGLAILLGSAAVGTEHGSVAALKTGAIITGCLLVAGALTRAIGHGHRSLAVLVWTAALGIGAYLMSRDVGWQGVAIIVAMVLVVGAAALSLVTESDT